MNKIKTTTDILYNKKINKDIIIAHISDIHFSKTTKYKKLEDLLNYIKNIKPNYIMITGDLIDIPNITKDSKIKELISFLTKLSKIAKVLISLGNHDIILKEDFIFFEHLNSLNNIHVLNDSSYIDEFIYVLGVTLPNEYYYNITGAESTDLLIAKLNNLGNLIHKLPKNIYHIAMIHSPINLTDKSVLEKLSNFDLILSGHTHNGMVPDCLNFLFRGNMGIIAPRKNWFPKIAKGKIVIKNNNSNITIIINGAITKLSLQSGKIFSKFNFVYNASVNKIILKKERKENE